MNSQIKMFLLMLNGNWFVFSIGCMICLSACTWNLDKIDKPCSMPNECFACGDSVWVDTRDGQEYRTVMIGTQCWFAQNLNFGTLVPSSLGQGPGQKYCVDDNTGMCDSLGGLYQFNTAVADYADSAVIQGICPEDWHIPTDNEWKILEDALGMSKSDQDAEGSARGEDKFVGNKLKFSNNGNNCDADATNCGDAQFDGLLGGWRSRDLESVQDLGLAEYWWTTTQDENFDNNYFVRVVKNDAVGVTRRIFHKEHGLCLRCVKD